MIRKLTREQQFLQAVCVEDDKINSHDVIKELLYAGVDVDTRDEYGNTALIIAVSQRAVEAQQRSVGLCNCEMVEILIEAGADIDVQNNYGVTALMHACLWNNQLHAIEKLLKYGADTNIKDSYNQNALVFACKNSYKDSHFEIVNKLFEFGASYKDLSEDSFEAVYHSAIYGNNPLLLDLILSKGFPDEVPYLTGAESPEVCDVLIKYNGIVNLDDDANKWIRSPLMSACRRGNVLVVKKLLEYGADVNRVRLVNRREYMKDGKR